MDLKLAGRRALITGSTTGIGESIARILAAEGVAVAINGRSEKRGQGVVDSINAAGGKAVLALGNVATDEGAEIACNAALEGLGGVDIIVNNAAGFAGSSSTSTVFDIPPGDWAVTFDMNVGAAMRTIQRLVPAMKERGWGRAIQIGSFMGMTPSGETPDYGVAKTAIVGLSLTMSRALAGTGVTSNTVSPGMIYTRSVAGWFKSIGAREGWGDDRAQSEAWVLKNVVQQTVSRIGQVEDIANAVTFLCSPLADFVSGINMKVDGGSSRSVS